MPCDVAAKLLEPTVRSLRIYEGRRVNDGAGVVVDECPASGAKETELGQG